MRFTSLLVALVSATALAAPIADDTKSVDSASPLYSWARSYKIIKRAEESSEAISPLYSWVRGYKILKRAEEASDAVSPLYSWTRGYKILKKSTEN